MAVMYFAQRKRTVAYTARGDVSNKQSNTDILAALCCDLMELKL